MNIDQFHMILAQPEARGYILNETQRQAVDFGSGPLWLVAGPGSGKTEVLVTRTLKLLAVDLINPRSIFITTFTKKAARNLEDRLASYWTVLQASDQALASVDLADIRIGTLHSLCDDILHEFRYPAYRNVRLLDDVEQHLFAYRHADITRHDDIYFWRFFEYAVPSWNAKMSTIPSRWQRAKAAVVLFNRLVEDVVDITQLRAAGSYWGNLAEFYLQYSSTLVERYRCDFAHVQFHFLNFLGEPSGQRFMKGDGESYPSLQYVLVDEYQDTNPIQERIYLMLASQAPHNLTVVGDDDQALYRFRGGTVDCMVNFDTACRTVLGASPTSVQLDRNYRSHPDIVNYFNEYIFSFTEMNKPGVRAPKKRPILPDSDIRGEYPAVAWITAKRVSDLPDALAEFINEHLLGDGVISDLKQCVLLMRSTKDSPRNAGPYLAAFREAGIPVYNPRSKSFMDSEEVQCLLASLIHVVDFTDVWLENKIGDLPKTVQEWITRLVDVHEGTDVDTEALRDYIIRSNDELPKLCAANRGRFLNLTLMEILYRILALEPFTSWRQTPERNLRLSKVTRLMESYHSLGLDALVASSTDDTVDAGFLERFYYMFIGYLIDAGIDDDEDEEVVVPSGALPIMTIHQSKGLEFPFVFVAQVGNQGYQGAAQVLERDLAPFRKDLYPRVARALEQMVLEDDIRLLYVAYSRAQYGLIIVASEGNLKNHVAVPGRDYASFRRNTVIIS